jgi:REP element-mobilizing transposase RayT
MPVPYTELFVHIVWATGGRLPLITDDVAPLVYGAIDTQCHRLNTASLAVGGTEDHVHLLVRLPPRLGVEPLVEAVKAASLHAFTTRIRPGWRFEWTATYGAFTLAQAEVPRAMMYVRSQKELHAAKTLWDRWERCEAPTSPLRPPPAGR